MKRKAVSGIMLTLLLVSILTFAFNIQPVKTGPKTIIVPDDFPTIQEAISKANDGDTIYVKAGIYNEHLTIDKSLTLIGENRNNTIIHGSRTGIGFHVTTDNVKVFRFTVKRCNYGIALENSRSSMLNGNSVIDSVWGILLFNSGGNVLKDNNMIGNDFNFGVGGRHVSFSDMVNDIDTSNKVDGKSIYYLINQHNFTIESSTFPEVGYLALVNSTNIRVENLTLKHNRHGILLFYATNVTIQKVVVSDNQRGITLSNSTNCTIIKNNLINNGAGIELFYSRNIVATANSLTNTIENEEGFMLFSSENCKVNGNIVKNTRYGTYQLYSNNIEISENNMINNVYGILLGYSNNNTITGNNVANNNYGIYFSYISKGNTISHNNFINNTRQVYGETSTNTWNDSYPSGGNYWSDYSVRYPLVKDEYQGENQDVLGRDGIWDSPYEIDVDNQDRYPLVEPWSPLPRIIDELKTKVKELGSKGEIENQGIVRSLIAKLNVAQKLVDKAKIEEAKSILEDDFIPQVQNLSGIRITIEVADILIQSVEYILSHI